MTKTMQAFNNDPQLKSDLLAEVEKHRLADQIIKGTYGNDVGGVWRGCAVGCSIRSYGLLKGLDLDTSDHALYPKIFGVPEWLGKLQDRIFEGLPSERNERWPGAFWSAINTGSDLDQVKAPFLIYILESALNTFDHAKFPDVKGCIDEPLLIMLMLLLIMLLFMLLMPLMPLLIMPLLMLLLLMLLLLLKEKSISNSPISYWN